MKVPPCPFNDIVGRIRMLNLEVRTVLCAEELDKRLRAFFGTAGLGLEIREEAPGRLTCTGGGGHVTAAFCPEGDRTRLRIATSGWAVPVKRFVAELP